MALADAEGALITAIHDELVKQFVGQAPPKTEDEGLQRIANAVGKAVIDTFNVELQVGIPNISSLPFSGSATIGWK
jgi:hypothetical protein